MGFVSLERNVAREVSFLCRKEVFQFKHSEEKKVRLFCRQSETSADACPVVQEGVEIVPIPLLSAFAT